MPYASNRDLPPRVGAHLPEHAQDIFRGAFNHAWAQYAGDARREEIAFRIAWAAVKKAGYRKTDGDWAEGHSF